MSTLTTYDLSMSRTVTFGDWLDERLQAEGLTRKELAAAIEMSEAAVYSWMAPPDAQHHRGVNPRSADRIAEVLGIHPNEVREVAGLPKKRLGKAPQQFARSEGLAAARVLLVPVIGIAPANTLRYAASVGEMLPVPASIVQDLDSPRAVIVSGDCLSSRGIHDGDHLIIDSIEAYYPQDGDIVVVRVGDDLTAKEWLRLGERVLLRPTEPGYETIELPQGEQDEIEIVGVARSVLSARRLK